ncbi:ribonuclease Oy-like [Contarinia nasturtii]|uniref:ribonuclease Oy-like n=1 Tax=Contarinia nasturtii TaxID=265458 RepID=UPI0012D3C5E6|nr:ribonuclease Oy-like [Contarinia nasturtii]
MFMQQWPTGYCINDNECIPPPDNETWGIHGIWPNNLDGSHPSFCSDSSSFDIESLKPFMEPLKQSWFSLKEKFIEKFWRHEWLKHGTLTKSLPDLNTEAKYFGQGLKWFQKYHIKNLLTQANIKPGTDYNIIDIHNALKNELDAEPEIACHKKEDTGEQYLVEIGICFSKRLELIDCGDILIPPTANYTTNHLILRNCNAEQPILYPSTFQ